MRARRLRRSTALVMLVALFVAMLGLIPTAGADYAVCAFVSYDVAGQTADEKQCLVWTEYERQETVGPTCVEHNDEFVCATVYDSYPPP